MKIEKTKEIYLKNFERKNDVEEYGFSNRAIDAGQAILGELKTKDLTYDDAYASLQWAYNKIQYESNFLKLS